MCRFLNGRPITWIVLPPRQPSFLFWHGFWSWNVHCVYSLPHQGKKTTLCTSWIIGLDLRSHICIPQLMATNERVHLVKRSRCTLHGSWSVSHVRRPRGKFLRRAHTAVFRSQTSHERSWCALVRVDCDTRYEGWRSQLSHFWWSCKNGPQKKQKKGASQEEDDGTARPTVYMPVL